MKQYDIRVEERHEDGEDYAVEYTTISEEQYQDVMYICGTTAESYMSIGTQMDKTYQQGKKDEKQRMLDILEKMHDTACAVMNPDWEYACERFSELIKEQNT